MNYQYKTSAGSIAAIENNKEILKGNGLRLIEAFGSIKTVSAIKILAPLGIKAEYYPFLKNHW